MQSFKLYIYVSYMISDNQWKTTRHTGDKFTWSKTGESICMMELLEADCKITTLEMLKIEKDKFEDFNR